MAAAREVAPLDPDKALAMLFDSGEAAGYAGDLAATVEAGRRAAELPLTTPEATFVIGLLSGVASLMEGKSAEAASALTAILSRAADLDDPRWLVWAAAAAAAIGDEGTGHSLYRRANALARGTAAVSTLTNVLEAFSFAGMLAGRYATVAADAAEGLALAREAGLTNSQCYHLATLAFVAAVQGREADCRSWAEEVAESASTRGLGLQSAIAEWALALLDLGIGHAADAVSRLRALGTGGPGTSHPFIVLAATPDLVEAAVRAGRPDVAQTALLALERFAERGTAPVWALALRARCRGLLSAGAAAERHFAEALSLHAQTQRTFDRARTQLAYGEHLRRSRRRLAAREQLRAALDGFERLGAGPWAERAATEVRATGEHARKRDYGTIDQLTPQELQIVRFVGEGASNKEVGAQLFLSPRTIDYHLRRIFIKLGISSRAELMVLRLGEGPAAPAS
jgi:ATP/maltotriose-dependent transcriptional regulator MalT